METKNYLPTLIGFDKLIERIISNFNSVEQWAERPFVDYDRVSKYTNKAKGIIEAMEIEVCGSIGGFDKGQREWMESDNREIDLPYKFVSPKLYWRYKWLEENYE